MTDLKKKSREENSVTSLAAEKQIEQHNKTTAESTTKDGNSMPESTSNLSITPRLCTTLSPGDPAICLSDVLYLAFHYIGSSQHSTRLY